MKVSRPDCQLIGAGRAGRVFCLAMTRAGYHYTWVGSKSGDDAAALAREAGLEKSGAGFEDFHGTAGFLIFAVPDDEIEWVAARAVHAGIIGEGSIAAHLSGALGSAVLAEVAAAGAAVMAFHPAQTFTAASDPGAALHGICFDMEGDEIACTLGERVAEDLGAVSVRLSPEARVLTHLAMTIASNYTVSLVHMAEEIIETAGVDRETAQKMLMPLATATVANISEFGTKQSLTGPISRGDVEIVRTHLTALKTIDERYARLYRDLAREALNIASERGSISREAAERMYRMLGET